jgi:hypothetical protein
MARTNLFFGAIYSRGRVTVKGNVKRRWIPAAIILAVVAAVSI